MNFKKSALASAITLATFATGAAAFDASSWEVSGFVKNETAALQGSGTFHGQQKTRTDVSSHNESGDIFKFENTAKVFLNGDIAENTALHAELNFVHDSEAPHGYKGHENGSQNDFLRELYVDSLFGENEGVEFRLGKQQVVWGTADGIKLLDIINPTDYREFAQNTMEDSRIPVWMIKADANVGDSGSLQLIVSEAGSNQIAGLNESGDQGHPFIMKGVDTISGKVNGFYNVVPEMMQVSQTFVNLAAGFAQTYNSSAYHLQKWTYASVDEFANNTGYGAGFAGACAYYGYSGANTGTACLESISFDDNNTANSSAGSNVTNLIDRQSGRNYNNAAGAAVEWDTNNPDSVFEYMPDATFATFATFAGGGVKWKNSLPSSSDANLGGRYKGFTDSGLNYSLNYLYAYDPNPYVDLYWADSTTGEKLTVTKLTDNSGYGTGLTTIQLFNSANQQYGAINAVEARTADLVFELKQNRIHNYGASFDYTIDSATLPVVVRGEFLYQKDVMSPVVNKAELKVGNLTEALKMVKGDQFKYVIGADVNIFTNMLMSGQFIQFRNLDYVDQTATVGSSSGARYTADMAVLHMSNGMKKAEENKDFYSIFLSKPFGANQLGRWNNIFIYEEGGGKWNRFDVEYSFSDELVGSFELNNYWGDANTQFGQMEDSSNIQVGLKYLF